MKTSFAPFVSPPGARFVASDSNAMLRPLSEIDPLNELPLASVPPVPTLARNVVLAFVSRTKTSPLPLASPGVRADPEENAIRLPSPEIDTPNAPPGDSAPVLLTLTRVVVAVGRSRTNTSSVGLVSFGTRLSENDSNATREPSPSRAHGPENRLPVSPCAPDCRSATSRAPVASRTT
jgi:hypothetical protein